MRNHAFDSTNTGLLDKVIWHMRTSQIRKRLPDEKVEMIVDLGCGHTAPLLQTLLQNNVATKAVGVDLAPDAAVDVERLSLVQADLDQTLPLENEQFDVVLSLAVIEHLNYPDTHTREVFRILKPGGRLLLTTPSPRGKPVLEFLAYRLRIIDRLEIEDHKQYFTGDMLRDSLERAGFQTNQIEAQTFQFGLNNIVLATK